jgi:carboxyl-terminal processing protease
VLPQVCTSLGAEAASAQLAALARGEQPMAGILARHRTARPPVSSEDMLAIRSACPAADGREGDLAAARFLIDHPTAYQTALLGPPPS